MKLFEQNDYVGHGLPEGQHDYSIFDGEEELKQIRSVVAYPTFDSTGVIDGVVAMDAQVTIDEYGIPEDLVQ